MTRLTSGLFVFLLFQESLFSMERLVKKTRFYLLIAKRCLKRIFTKMDSSEPKEVIWIFGPSSIGKKSLMFRLANPAGRHSATAASFSLEKNDMVLPVVIPSRTIGKTKEERVDVIVRRLAALEGIYRSNLRAKWIVHMQSIDIRENIAAKVLADHPRVLSRCFYMHIDEYKYAERCKRPEISYAQAYALKDKHLKLLEKIFDHVSVVNI